MTATETTIPHLEADEARLSARAVVDELKRCGISHVVWLPDSESKHLYDLLHDDETLKLVPICREGEAIGIALGLMVGGKTPAVVIQNTGLFESGDSLRGLGINLRLPLLMLVSYRGWKSDGTITDSAAIYLEPVLDGWGITSYLVETDDDVHLIGRAFQEAGSQRKPVAVLMAREYI
jgi:sulfopyruvate decarboxylase TPP-binding subunit